MQNRRFFTGEMCCRLRQLRLRAGLTQDEVAERMDIVGKGRRNVVWLLERGVAGNPSLQMIARYLRACGARWKEFTDLLERPDYLPDERGQLDALDLPEQAVQKVEDATALQVERYQERQPYRKGVPPMHPRKETSAAERFRCYRIVTNVVELAIFEVLKEEDITILRIPGYRAAGRAALGLLWRQVRTEPGRQQIAARGELPERLNQKLAAKTQRWQELKLDLDIVQRVQAAVIDQFRTLLEKNPGLFPLRE